MAGAVSRCGFPWIEMAYHRGRGAKAGTRKRSFCDDGHHTPCRGRQRERAEVAVNHQSPSPSPHTLTLSSIPLDSSPSTNHSHSTHHLDPGFSQLLPADVNPTTSIVIKSYRSAPSRTNRHSVHDTTRNYRPNGLPLLFGAVPI
jgi:hypothetical protein